MNTAFQDEENVHIGLNVKQIREIMGIKQSALSDLRRSNFIQQRVSEFENAKTSVYETIITENPSN